MSDPTADEMREYLKDRWELTPESESEWAIDVEEVIYWFAYAYHDGQWSELYSALSTSEFHPGSDSAGVEPDTLAAIMLADLIEEYAQ